ncbi:hypothetical protein [Paenibacillus sp. MMS20-IR301]|uniref:hypothetical protein n=1 Tax=Paenibacillus sp. MMS20-IR301 TaxID=2895946 RepID=UPI0028EE7CBC|nr:hypothetical protein [Paenibacillus sp. MMS20-IR301]WNS45609.1 hypothetical protein LOS79_10165 [Paenibacillus sp. MMS20-IR301]
MFRKPLFWSVLLLGICGITAAVLLWPGDPQQPAELTERDYAEQYVKQSIESYQREWPEVVIKDSKIVKFEQIAEFSDLLAAPVKLWRLEYRLTPEDPDKVMLPGGMQVVDGQITEDGSMGKPVLMFSYSSSAPEYLGELWNGENDLGTPAGQETALRKFLEGQGKLPHETFSGSHILVQFPLTSGDTSQLLLSQPVKRGEQGIWAVERWMDTNGNEYYAVPQTGESPAAYYAGLQARADAGTEPALLDPVQVAVQYIKTEIGLPVSRDKLVINYEATAEDFAVTPVSSLIGYVTGLAREGDKLSFDQVEWLTLEDSARFAGLGLTEEDLPGGFYILNKYKIDDHYTVTAETEYELIDRDNLGSKKSVSKDEFIAYYEQFSSWGPPCRITVSESVVKSVSEVYVP